MDDFLSEFIVKKRDFRSELLERKILDENNLKTCLFISSSQNKAFTAVIADHTKDEEAVLRLYAEIKELEFAEIDILDEMEKNFDESFATSSVEYFTQHNPILPFRRIDGHKIGCLTTVPDDLFMLESMEKFFISTVAVPIVCTSITLEIARERFNKNVLLFTADGRGKQRIQFLCNHCDIGDVPFMISVLKRTDDAENILKVINTLGRMRKSDALPTIEKFIHHPDTMIKSAALTAKSKILGTDSAPASSGSSVKG